MRKKLGLAGVPLAIGARGGSAASPPNIGTTSTLFGGYIIPVAGTGPCAAPAFGKWHLAKGRYLVDSHSAGSAANLRYVAVAKGNPRRTSAFYSAEHLQASCER
jgi:hypothetical protein